MNAAIIKLISEYSTRYQEEYLSDYDTDDLQYDWWEAFDFFLSKSCFQGRSDRVSLKVYHATIEILSPLFEGKYQTTKFRLIKANNWRTVRNSLKSKIGKGKVGKGRDIDMIISSLSFLDRLDDKNIVNYSVRMIENGKMSELYKKLQNAQSDNGIVQVGPKIASFFLRDLVFLFDLSHKMTPEIMSLIQPVDTWVKQVCQSIGIASMDDSIESVRNQIIMHCNSANVDPLDFNQGTWYVGYHSYNLVLKGAVSKLEGLLPKPLSCVCIGLSTIYYLSKALILFILKFSGERIVVGQGFGQQPLE